LLLLTSWISHSHQAFISSTSENDNYLGYFTRTNENLLVPEDIPEQYLVALSHFLPFRFTRKYNLEKRRKQAVESYIHQLFEGRRGIRRRLEHFNAESPIPSKLKDAIDVLCKGNGIDATFCGQTLADLVRWTRELRRTSRKRKIFTDIQEVTIQEFLNEDEADQNFEGLESIAYNIYLDAIEQIIERIASFFTSKIRYLGPLRADPQASQKFGPSSELDDVGSKGEFAAAVYDSNHAARIEWYNPQNKQVEKGGLREAVDCWAQYLGVAQQVKTEMAGLSGVAWKIISRAGRKPRSLPEVGVGISQILPILIMGLLSPVNSLLIIEQPELHLHPYVQARLGDFFMGLAKCKKQCLIETHSENLVSQLRLHIVEAGGLEKSDCVVYFVDQNEKGAAKFEKIEISSNGNILNWPDGFFDETMLQEDRITAASLRKRAQEAKHGS
jgi:predicted ATPase